MDPWDRKRLLSTHHPTSVLNQPPRQLLALGCVCSALTSTSRLRLRAQHDPQEGAVLQLRPLSFPLEEGKFEASRRVSRAQVWGSAGKAQRAGKQTLLQASALTHNCVWGRFPQPGEPPGRPSSATAFWSSPWVIKPLCPQRDSPQEVSQLLLISIRTNYTEQIASRHISIILNWWQ